MEAKQKLVNQYFAQVFDEYGIVTINSETLPDCKRKVQNTFSHLEPHFVENKDSTTLNIYAGDLLIGWMTEIEVPEVLTARRYTETLRKKAA